MAGKLRIVNELSTRKEIETKVVELNIPAFYFPLLLDCYAILLIFKLKLSTDNALELAMLESEESQLSSVIFSLPN